MALDTENGPCQCVYPNKCFCSQIELPREELASEPFPSGSFDMFDDDSLERLCIDAGEELLRRYGVRLDAFAQTIKELGL